VQDTARAGRQDTMPLNYLRFFLEKALTTGCNEYYNTIGHAMGIIKPE
jgi:hypothetical protein